MSIHTNHDFRKRKKKAFKTLEGILTELADLCSDTKMIMIK